MRTVIHFEIHAEDTARAVKFYGDVFGWKFQEYPGMDYWLVQKAPEDKEDNGISGAIMKRKGDAPANGQPVNAFVCTFAVENIDSTIEKAVKAGGTEALAKMAVTGIGWCAYYKDTEGNIFGMIQPDMSVKG